MRIERRTYTASGELLASEEVEVPDSIVNGVALHDGLEQSLEPLRAYIAAPAPTQAQTVAVVKVLCRAVVRLVRLRLGRLEGTE